MEIIFERNNNENDNDNNNNFIYVLKTRCVSCLQASLLYSVYNINYKQKNNRCKTTDNCKFEACVVIATQVDH